MLKSRPLALLGTLSLFTAVPALLSAQQMDVPARLQIPLLYKILSFDRNFTARAGDQVVIAIIYQSGFRASVVAREQIEDALGHTASPFGTRSLRWVAIEAGSGSTLEQALREHEADVIYVTPLRGVDLDVIADAARRSRLMTFTGIPPYVERGLSVGVGIEQERPMIIINLAAARAEGADYTAQLLRVSRVIGEAR
jgi:hypothetical protein